jgi:ornithine cyclodeaminase
LGELVRGAGELGTEWGLVVDSQRVDALKGGDVTLYKSVGVGAMDVAIACAVVGRAKELSLGVNVEEF